MSWPPARAADGKVPAVYRTSEGRTHFDPPEQLTLARFHFAFGADQENAPGSSAKASLLNWVSTFLLKN
jgi:hypothetical protein